jgi:hypothetical protein
LALVLGVVGWRHAAGKVTTIGAVMLGVLATVVKLYNDNWSREPPITAEEFAKRIKLVDVCVPSDGKDFTLWFTDGEIEMFGGHSIHAFFGSDRQLRSADLAG